jgi:hypothetical protein
VGMWVETKPGVFERSAEYKAELIGKFVAQFNPPPGFEGGQDGAVRANLEDLLYNNSTYDVTNLDDTPFESDCEFIDAMVDTQDLIIKTICDILSGREVHIPARA